MITPQYIDNIREELNLPNVDARVLKTTAAAVEMETKKVVELALKLQKRAKRQTMSVDDINLALSIFHNEHIYGLRRPPTIISVGENGQSDIVQDSSKIDLMAFLKKPIGASVPRVPAVHVHWLAVDGVQPTIPENPAVVYYDPAADLSGLPREMAFFYTRVTSALLSGQHEAIKTVCSLLREDRGLQELGGYFCRFFYVHIRRNLSVLSSLVALVKGMEALLLNPFLNLETCMHQLLPSLMSCVVAANLGGDSSGSGRDESGQTRSAQEEVPAADVAGASWGVTHFDLRHYAAAVVAVVIDRYSEKFPDLLPRVCRTYLEAVTIIDEHSTGRNAVCLGAMFGGIVGLAALGDRVISTVLLPNFDLILEALYVLERGTLSQNPAPVSNEESSSSTGMISKKRRLSTTQTFSDDSNVLVGSGRGFSGGLRTRYLSDNARTPMLPTGGVSGAVMCRGVLLQVLGTYIMRTTEKPGEFYTHRRNRSNGMGTFSSRAQQRHGEDAGWTVFVEEHGEQLTPYFVRGSQEIDYCRLPL